MTYLMRIYAYPYKLLPSFTHVLSLLQKNSTSKSIWNFKWLKFHEKYLSCQHEITQHTTNLHISNPWPLGYVVCHTLQTTWKIGNRCVLYNITYDKIFSPESLLCTIYTSSNICKNWIFGTNFHCSSIQCNDYCFSSKMTLVR